MPTPHRPQASRGRRAARSRNANNDAEPYAVRTNPGSISTGLRSARPPLRQTYPAQSTRTETVASSPPFSS